MTKECIRSLYDGGQVYKEGGGAEGSIYT